MPTTDQWFSWVSIGYLIVLFASAVAAVWLWKLNDDHELGTKNRTTRIRANIAVLTLAIIGVFASVVLFSLSQRANGEASARMEEARSTANVAQAQAGQALKDAGEANERASKANERAAALEAANLKLEAQIQPRRLASIGGLELSRLEKFSGTSVIIRSSAYDVDAAVLGGQIIDLLSKMQYKIIDQRMSDASMGIINLGVFISGPNYGLVMTIFGVLKSHNIMTYIGNPKEGVGISLGNRNESADATYL